MADARELFHKHGLRCTRQREVLYDALAQNPDHPTAEDLHQFVRACEPSLSLATVYNTLEAFWARGLVRKLPACDGKGACRYDAILADHAHVTLPDGRVVDMPGDLSTRLLDSLPTTVLAELAQRLGVPVDRLSVQVVAHAEPECADPDEN